MNTERLRARASVLVAPAIAVLIAGEWLRRPGLWAAVGAGVVALAVAVVLWRAGSARGRLSAVLLAGVALAIGVTAARQDRVERHWGVTQAMLIDSAFQPVGQMLGDAKDTARVVAVQALRAARLPPAGAFSALRAAVRTNGPEQGVVLFDAAGSPRAWAGVQRSIPTADGPALQIRRTAFAFLLEVRRRDASGATALVTVLLSAKPTVLGAERSLAAQFEAREGVGLTFYEPGLAPASRNVFEWAEPTEAGQRLLIGARPVPPEQRVVRQAIVGVGSQVVAVLLLAVLLTMLSMVESVAARGAVLLILVWLPLRAPMGRALGLEALFAPTSYFLAWGGPFTSSAGALLLVGLALLIGGSWLHQRAPSGNPLVRVAATLAALVVPALMQALAGGITLPAEGADLPVWLVWQLAIGGAGLGVLLVLSALVRTRAADLRRRQRVGVALALAASVLVPTLWQTADGVPWALTALAGLGAALALGGLGPIQPLLLLTLVAGGWSAAVVWDGEIHDRLGAVQRDVTSLNDETDALAFAQLQTFADNVLSEPAPASRADLFALWQTSSLRQQQRYPAMLALFAADGTLRQRLALDSLDLSVAQLSSITRLLAPGEPRAVARLRRDNGTYHLLLLRLARGDLLAVAIAPRSRLIEQTRLGKLLDPGARVAPDYTLSIVPTSTARGSATDSLAWSRGGWRLTARARLASSVRASDVLARIDLGGPVPLMLRIIALLALDLLLVAVLYFVMQRAAGHPLLLPSWRTSARGFRARLGLALAVFVLLPIIATALWSFARLDDEGVRARDLVLGVLLRDAPDTDGAAPRSPSEAEPARYPRAVLDTTTAPLSYELGLMNALVPPEAYQALVLRGQAEATVLQGTAAIGYREATIGRGSGDMMLAVPIPLADPVLARSQLDLVLGVLVAALGGAVAALAGAAWASRLLARPVAELRRAALAIGRGSAVPQREGVMPMEFEPVFGAFERMAEDLHAGREALETAQQRLSATLATVATGVVALDDSGFVLVANPRAVTLLGQPIPEGQPFGIGLGPLWSDLLRVVEQARRPGSRLPEPRELAFEERRLLLTVTRLGAGVPGLVLALNDVTELSRAERVLAWGEMAQQVAHEIKNPLTPMRLGVQHLQRAWRDRRETFDGTLEETAKRILEEIDRLDGVARAFSRFAAPAPTPGPLAPIDVAAVARDVVQLYRLSGEGAEVRVEADGPMRAPARTDELKEVLVNLLENARAAGATEVVVRVGLGALEVADNGSGVPVANLGRVFEPRFSTNTSGSGLGLAIVKRLVEGWNGHVEIRSEEGTGTTLRVVFSPGAPRVP